MTDSSSEILTLHTPAQACGWLRGLGLVRLQTDSRKVSVGDGFIAWPGAVTDGRSHVAAALDAGAKACLVEAEGSDAFNFQDSRVALYPGLKLATGLIAAEYFSHPSQDLNLIAVTGTNGKTTTAWLLSQAIAKAYGKACGLVGTLGIGMAVSDQVPQVTHNGLTTPDPVMLQEALAGMKNQGASTCVLEASSIGVAERRLDGTHIKVAVFTNFTQDHLDYHGSMQAYWACKQELFAWKGLLATVVNVDDAKGVTLAQSLISSGLDLWTVSIKGQARLRASELVYANKGLGFVVHENHTEIRLQTHLIGEYNVSNVLCVIASMRALGISLEQAVDACRDLSSVPGRMQCIEFVNSPLAVVDYAHTPDALAKALQALHELAELRGGRLWCLFGCGGNRDTSKRALMGHMAQMHADQVVLTSDNPRNEAPEKIAAQVMLGMTPGKQVHVQTDRALAIAYAVSQAQPHDVILVAGKGHEDYQEVAGKKIPFIDAEHVRRAFVQKGYTL